MNKCAAILIACGMLLTCSKLENPYDSNSSNYVSDSTLVSYVTQTLMDTSFIIDTLIHIDTIFHIETTQHIDTSFFVDTTKSIDTLVVIDSVKCRDTVFIIDTTISMDSITIIDTTTVFDTVTFIDSSIFVDTTTVLDTITVFDTLAVFDTTTIWDSVTVLDTTIYVETTHDTLWHFDTSEVYDTTHLIIYDTTFVLDTMIDTIYHYFDQPIISWTTGPDSTPFEVFHHDSVYTINWSIKGIDPAEINVCHYKRHGSNDLWLTPAKPFSLKFLGPNPQVYDLFVMSSKGNYHSTWTIRCDELSQLRLSAPVLSKVQYYTHEVPEAGGFYQATHFQYVPVCTLYADSLFFTPFPNRIDLLVIQVYMRLPGCKAWDYYWSLDGRYNTAAIDREYIIRNSIYKEFEIFIEEMPVGNHHITACAQCISPDTSMLSAWITMPIVVMVAP